jgi:hypothetical protein
MVNRKVSVRSLTNKLEKYISKLPDRTQLTQRGQSLVEVALLFPVLLILLSGLLEFGFLLNEYLTLQDAVRNAARFSSDSDYTVTDVTAVNNVCTNGATGFPREECCMGSGGLGGTVDFYRQTACLVNVEMNNMAPDVSTLCLRPGANGICEYGILDPNSGDPGNRDDIVISVFSIDQHGTPQIVRFGGANGWSYSEHYVGYGGGRNQNSRFSTADIASRLDMAAPNTGYVLVEIFYNYAQKLSLPWITAFVHDPVMLHAYTIMPLTSAEPTPTPIP